ncbi:MAG: DUF4358 domain-containing protein [Peptostreptococcaceae bacterium]
MNKFKSIIFITLIVFILILSVGCSNKNDLENNPQKHDNKVEDVLNSINTPDYLSITETNEFVNTPIKEYVADELNPVKDKLEDGFVLTYPLTNKLQEVIFIKTNDVKSVNEALENLITNNLKYKQFADGYGSEENITIMANSILNNKGNYVYFIAAPKAKDIENKILEIIK